MQRNPFLIFFLILENIFIYFVTSLPWLNCRGDLKRSLKWGSSSSLGLEKILLRETPSGGPLPRHGICMHACVLSRFSHASSLWPYGPYPSRLLCPWDSPGKNTRVGCHVFLQGIFPSSLLCLLHWQVDSLPLVPPGKPLYKTHLVVNPLICGHLGFLWMRQANKCVGLLWNPSHNWLSSWERTMYM